MSDKGDEMSEIPAGTAPAGTLAPLPEGLVGEILPPGSEAEQRQQEASVRRGFFKTMKRAMRHIPFAEDVVASYYCALDSKTPAASRGILLAALAYFVLPFDAIPDFIVGLGYTDDMAILLAAFTAVRNNIRPEHYDKAREVLTPDEAPGEGQAKQV
ncbi:YkvA family protein [Aureimonas sp. N4]|uniref:YkvA family protein n=1 Tax=Aureimonas sp. N4 TaxID=1638165 RepID=UPI0009E965F7|nr:YkvA family protein [Aureimonas sp. N4]